MKHAVDKLKSGNSLSFAEAKAVTEEILKPSTPPEEIIHLLTALRDKKETLDEIEGFLAAIRATTDSYPKMNGTLIDVCGTGGDGIHTFNISTGVAIVLGSLGFKVAKHGNRSVSSLSGSSDVLQALGIPHDTSILESQTSLARNNLSFLHAPAFYPALARLASIRKSIGTFTIFNALGPLLNPAPITHQLMGVYTPSLLMPAALAIQSRGIQHAMIVRGSDGLDELTLSSETHVIRVEGESIKSLTLVPENFGLSRADLNSIRGGNPAENAQILLDIYSGHRSAKRDLLVMNAAAAIALLEGHENFKLAVSKIESAIDSGATLKFVEGLKKNARSRDST